MIAVCSFDRPGRSLLHLLEVLQAIRDTGIGLILGRPKISQGLERMERAELAKGTGIIHHSETARPRQWHRAHRVQREMAE